MRRAYSGAPKFVEPSLPRHAPINKPMRACTDRGQCACVQPLNRLCVSARAAKSSWTHKVCVLSARLCAQLRGKGHKRVHVYMRRRCVLRGREARPLTSSCLAPQPIFFFLLLSLSIFFGRAIRDCSRKTEQTNEFFWSFYRDART